MPKVHDTGELGPDYASKVWLAGFRISTYQAVVPISWWKIGKILYQRVTKAHVLDAEEARFDREILHEAPIYQVTEETFVLLIDFCL